MMTTLLSWLTVDGASRRCVGRALGVLLLLGLTGGLAGCDESPSAPSDDAEIPREEPKTTTPLQVAIGDTVVGELGAADSVINYYFEGQADEYVQLHFQAGSPSTSAILVLEFLAPTGEELERVLSRGDDPLLKSRSTRIHRLAESGTYTVRVRGSSVGDHGAFGFAVYHAGRPISIGDTVIATTYAYGAPVVFPIEIADDQEFIIGLRTILSSAPGGLSLQFAREGGGVDDWDYLFRDDTTELVTRRILIQPGGRFQVIVKPFRQRFDTRPIVATPFQLRLLPIDRMPERLGVKIMPGDTVSGESIDHVGDMDEFIFEGRRGEAFNFHFQALTGSADARLSASILGFPPQAPGVHLHSSGTDTSLTVRRSGRFTLPYSGTYTIRVEGVEPWSARHVGAYRFFLYPVNPAPESIPAQIGLNQKIEGESIDQPTDFDEFSFTLSERTEILPVILSPYNPGPRRGPLRFEIIQEVSGATQEWDRPLPAGSYRMRIMADWEDINYTGPYSFVIYSIDRAPESAPQRIAIGDTIYEAIDHWGDIDDFFFEGRSGQQLDVRVRSMDSHLSSVFHFAVYDQVTGNGLTFTTGNDGAERHTGRFTIPTDGTYRIVVEERTGGTSRGGPYPYRLYIKELDTSL